MSLSSIISVILLLSMLAFRDTSLEPSNFYFILIIYLFVYEGMAYWYGCSYSSLMFCSCCVFY